MPITEKKIVSTNIEQQVTNIEHRVTNIEQQVTNIEHRVTNIEQQVTNIEHRVTNIEQQVTNIEHRVTNTEHRIIRLENDVNWIKWILSGIFGLILGLVGLITYFHNDLKSEIRELKKYDQKQSALINE